LLWRLSFSSQRSSSTGGTAGHRQWRLFAEPLRATPAQRRRLWGLLVSAGDVWACVLELNALRRSRGDAAVVSYQELCRELSASGTGCFGELSSVGARSVLRRYSDAWFSAAKARRAGTRPPASRVASAISWRCATTRAPLR
jgi:hypothetical protein